jgi:cytochrome bd-type quinol oxidase subunit 2
MTTAAYMLVATAIVLYAVLAGADAGIGFWFLASRRSTLHLDPQHELLARFSPVWEVNGLFLIFATTGMLASFPQALGTLGTALIPLYLPVVVLIPARGASYALLHHRSERVQRIAGVLFGSSSVGIGLVIGYTTLGLPAGLIRGSALNPGYFVSFASLASLPFLVLGIAYAGATAANSRKLVKAASWTGLAWLATIVPYAYALARANPLLRHRLLGPEGAVFLVGAAVVFASLGVHRHRRRLGRALSAAGCAAIGLGLAAATLPYVAYPTIQIPVDAGPSVRAYVVASLIGGPLLLGFVAVLYAMVDPDGDVGIS